MIWRDRPMRTALLASLGLLLILAAAELVVILRLNGGFFTYTLDDPYIHLALAENIRAGHYGINRTEPSSPASSILWPFLLAPVAGLNWFPLLLNLVFAALTLTLIAALLDDVLPFRESATRAAVAMPLLVDLALGMNLIGLAFTGMEHSLQILLIVAAVRGLVVELRHGRPPAWLWAALVLGPLVRYENLAISLAALLYLFLRGYRTQVLASAALIGLAVGSFSLFLLHLGLPPLPTSVMVKSPTLSRGGQLAAVVENVLRSLRNRQGRLIIAGTLLLLGLVFYGKHSMKEKQLAAVTALAVTAHLIMGRYGWYNRYELYIWTFLLLMHLSLWGGGAVAALWQGEDARRALGKTVTVCGLGMLVLGFPYFKGLTTLPLAANNTFEQHYQMHRFAVDYYARPVAVNDLGYVAYQNPHYVLDLWGLASERALACRRGECGADWMDMLTEAEGVGVAMIYEAWFPVPAHWIKMGELHLGRRKITPAYSTVAFFAVDEAAYAEAMPRLQRFVATLPPGVTFTWGTDGVAVSHRSPAGP